MFKGLFVIFLLTIAVCVARTPDSEECDAQRKCKEPFTSCIEGYCEHKGVFPAEWQEVLGASLLFVTTAMCNAAGISGGGIIVTIGIGLFYLSSKEAVAMSNVLIFFGCVTRFTINFKQRHPLKDATSIDYGVVTCQLPLVMLGTFLGVQLNELLAETLIFILLFLTFAALTYRSFRKGIDVSKREKREKKERAKCLDETRLLTDHPQVESISSIKETEEYKETENEVTAFHSVAYNDTTLIPKERNRQAYMSLRENINITLAQGEIIDYNTKGIDSEDRDHLLGERKSAYNVEHMNPTLEKYIRVEKSHFRPRYILTVICPFLSILFIGLFRGNNTIDSIVGVEVCSAWYFILLGVQVIVLALLGLINVLILRKEYREKIECGYQFVSGDVIWDANTTTKFVIFALIAGFVSGSVGFSRGVLFTPLFIDFGIPPTVASSTSMYMATFATLSSSILFMMSGYIIYDVVFYLSAFAIIGTILGTTIVSQKIRKSGNVAILIWLIATVNLLSCIAEIIVGTVRIIDKNNRKDEIWDFTTPC